ncbi:MAG: preprotein translocase subunit SecG [Nitrospinota bacterium]|nr:preprotein translocase subunit SecG [Nitrospinota bacterium]
MLVTIFTVVHIVSAVVMVAVILFLQQGKGAQIGSTFGGSSQTVFGSRGPAGAMAKVTTAAAVVFMVSSLVLSALGKQQLSESLITDDVAPMTLPVTLPGEGEGAPGAPAGGPVAPVGPEDTQFQEQAGAPVGPVDTPQESTGPAGN